MQEIILASQSQFRKNELKRLGLKFSIVPAHIDEKKYYEFSASKRAVTLATDKVTEVSTAHPTAVIIGADTFGVFKNQYLEKARSAAEVIQILSKISGQRISFVTGVAIYLPRTKKIKTMHDESFLTMKQLSSEKITRYAQSNEWMGMAGGFTLLKKGIALVDSFEGSMNTILGFPTEKIVDILEKEGIQII